MPQPLLSITIPTKNRSDRVRTAIKSLMAQDFTDFEVVVVDNDDTDDTARVVASFDDPRVRHVRTGSLSMPENWRAALESAQGQYVTIMGDKLAYYAGALARVAAVIQAHQPQVITYAHDNFYDDGEHPYMGVRQVSGAVTRYTTEAVLRLFLDHDWRHVGAILPRGYNSFARRDLLETIRQSPAGAATLPVNPDYTHGFLLLAFATDVWHIDEALYASSTAASNGQAIITKNPAALWFIQSIGDETRFYEHVPIKSYYITSNIILNDFYAMQALVGGNLSGHARDPETYFMLILREIVTREQAFPHVDFSAERAAWETALAEQPAELRGAIRQQIEQATAEEVIKQHLKAMHNHRQHHFRVRRENSPPRDILTAMAAAR